MTRPAATRPSRYDIVIVGAGPVGLTLASLLRHQGLAILVIERRHTAVTYGRAMHLDRGSVELLQRAGMCWEPGVDLDPLAGVAFCGPAGAEFRIALGGLCPELIAPFAFFQPAVERALTSELERSPVELAFGATLVGLELAGDAVRLEVAEGLAQARRRVSAPLVVGCDGAASAVRGLARLPVRCWLAGASWRATDYRLAHRLPDRLVRHSLEPRPTTVVPGCGPFARFETREHRGRSAPGEPPRAAAGRAFGVEIDQTMASRSYRYDTRIAVRTSRRVGRSAVVIMGDAAHTVAPFLGQGLGLGLRDAEQLAALLTADRTVGSDRSVACRDGDREGCVGLGDAAALVARYERARRRDVATTATQSMLAQLLVEHGGSWAPRRLERVLAALSRLGGMAPSAVHHLALAHRRTELHRAG